MGSRRDTMGSRTIAYEPAQPVAVDHLGIILGSAEAPHRQPPIASTCSGIAEIAFDLPAKLTRLAPCPGKLILALAGVGQLVRLP